ncbi:tRNA (adenosine(37)-N6)-threonylcarbamoyltransferase complex dimerization subunit type 1 TsaB [Leuconostoc holzapfelii]|uniref:tRNA (Adenosine(37)-N6)-threonylcarbamoyltransferase complex dimerization subunit type 1 TsaB n=1 Tax=Leuconostoc holzapfelii TaxID=434464 RepID=A0ABT2NV90_9LACO|nr:tRNA (adenosine(37)-N6)-threonylcarbamoyltransferase complex dimerization subunit type 1 TsaB [Leuconostoc holzapfelii]MCT8389288.1 tRNA (adenosine(37)-N6)-threonylcarbamoyltransferase complex dimerization subunit type 1 TsaB [Leuconostoc holzapfelii]
MKILAFDTSNQPLTVSLAENSDVLRVLSTNEARNHSIQLLPAIQATLAEQNWPLSAIDRIVVAQGPGSFTGLRIGVTVAKMLAQTLQAELVGVSSLAVLAAQVTRPGLVVPLFNARNNNVFAGVYLAGENVLPDAHQSLDQLTTWLQTRTEPITFVGETTEFSSTLTQLFGDRAMVETPTASLPDGHGIVALGYQAQPSPDVAHFNPNYLRKTQAELNWLAAHPGEDHPENYVFEV